MAKRKRTEAQRMAELRRRGNQEISKLKEDLRRMRPSERQSSHADAYRQQILEMRDTINRTYLTGTHGGIKASKDQARAAAEKLRSQIGIGTRTSARGRLRTEREAKARQERRNVVYRSQLRMESRGGTSAMFGGAAAEDYREKIFYMSTQHIWRGLAPEDRDKAILKALGTDSLEEAYQMVMAENEEALEAARDASRADPYANEDPYAAMVGLVNVVRRRERGF